MNRLAPYRSDPPAPIARLPVTITIDGEPGALPGEPWTTLRVHDLPITIDKPL